MKIFSKIAAFITAVGLTVGMCGLVSFAENAENTPDGYVTISVEKFTIGQGYVVNPTKVPFYEGETGMDVLERAVGKDNIAITISDWGNYISGYADTDTGTVNLSESLKEVLNFDDLTARTADGYLSEYDYTSEGGFMFFLNNQSSMVGVDGYTPADGDVLRMQFTIYGYGSDLGIDNTSWGGYPSIVPETNRDALTVLIAETLANNDDVDCSDAIAVISNLDSIQTDIDTAYANLEKAIKDAGNDSSIIDSDDEKQEENSDSLVENNDDSKSPSTGISIMFITPFAILALGLAIKKSKLRE